MTAVYSPDVAPELTPGVVHWQPRPGYVRRAFEQRIALAIAVGAVGALAIGAVALGALAIGRLSVGRAHIRRLDIDDLGVGRIRRLRRPF